jgi:hypothetical protein
MVNLNHFIKAKQVKCMHNIIHSELDKWNVIGKYWLTSMDSKFETDFFSVNVMLSDLSMRSSSWENDAFIRLYSAFQFLLSRSLLNISVEFTNILLFWSQISFTVLNPLLEKLDKNRAFRLYLIFELPNICCSNIFSFVLILLFHWNIQ